MNEPRAKTAPQETNPASLFDRRATDYVKYRPSYPAAAIDAILAGLGVPSTLTAADIGAGTGIASRLLAERGAKIISIEPNAAMRAAAAPHPLIDSRNASAEQTNLPDESVDLVTCFQAFHWFKPQPTLQEFHRILKPSGRLALIWNDWVADSNFFAQFGEIIRKAVPNPVPGGKQRGAINPLWSSPNFIRVRPYKFMHAHELDLPGLIGYAQSKSSVPREGPAQQQLILDLQELHARWADRQGIVSLHYCASVYLAEPQIRKLNYRKLMPPWLLGKGRKIHQSLTAASSLPH
jgi:SAM-dependent methyltransferase